MVYVKTSQVPKDITNGRPLSLIEKEFQESETSRSDKVYVTQDQENSNSSKILTSFFGTQKSELDRTRKETQTKKREGNTAKILAIITGVFIVCWLPFFVVTLLIALCNSECEIPRVFKSTILWLGYVNSLLNPIIYTIFSPDFKNAFRRMLGIKQNRR